MRITKQPSAGRGEYELSEFAPNGLNPNHLLEHTIQLRVGGIVINTSVKVTRSQGKYRLRRLPPKTHPQVQIQIANALLLPETTRSEQSVTGGEPVLQNKNYIIKNIHFGDVYQLEEKTFIAEVLVIDGANRTVEAHQVPVVQRIQEIERIWSRRADFPTSIASLLTQHEGFVRSGGPIPRQAGRIIQDLQQQVEAFSNEFEIIYTHTTDVVPALLSILNEVVVSPPLPLNQIEPDQIQVLKREITRWQQFVRRRGAASVKFRKDVQRAYNFRCLMCSGRFPATSVNINPGVDAAHILPWADYDLDRVYNGLALCKLHHWAFDERLLQIKFRDGEYYVELSSDAAQQLFAPDFGIDILRKVVGKIPRHSLPANESDWPNPGLLDRLYTESV